MKKLAYVYVCYGATLAIILAIAALPYSSWAFKNHVDILTGGWQITHSMFSEDNHADVEPVRITQSWNLTGMDYKSQHQGYPWEETIDAYVKSARQNPNDPAKLAHLIRQNFRASAKAVDANFNPPNPFWAGYTIGEVREQALWAATRGAQLDPDNAYFTSSEAILLDWSGRRAEAYQALHEAAKAHRYDEYAAQEGVDRTAAIISRWGYRGEKPRLEALGSIFLPHYAALKEWARGIAALPKTKDNVQAQADMLRVADTMERTDPFLIGTLVAMSIADIILLPPAQVAQLQQPDGLRSKADLNLIPRVSEFNALQKKLGVDRPYDPSEMARAAPRMRAAAKDFDDPGLLSVTTYFSYGSTAYPPIALFTVLSTVLFAALLSKIKPRGDLAQRMLPYAGSIAVLWFVNGMTPYSNTVRFLSPEYYWGLMFPEVWQMHLMFTVAMAVCGVAQIWPKLRKWAAILAILVCGVTLVWSYPQAYLYLPAIAFGVLLVVSRISLRVGSVVLGFIMACLFGLLAFGYVNLALSGPDQIYVAYIVAVVTIAAALFFANGSRRLLAAMPVVTLLFAVSYLGAVIREVRQNQEMKSGIDGWAKEADIMRAKAGIQ